MGHTITRRTPKMSDIEKSYTGWITISQPLMMPKDEIMDAKVMAFKSKGHPDDGCYVVRLIKQTPTIEFVCKDAAEAQELCDWLKAFRKVITVDFKKGK